jgi:CRISPR/Cas system-associated exonuclease Cas4 (RecB family)
MIAFLQKIAESVTKENLPYLYTRCYIFPTKRAAIYFTNFLKEKHKEENFILPETITIQEFITTYSSFIIKDDWYLLLELYQIQNELTKTHQRLEKFLPWGKLILKDFDECDKYLVNATQLFSVLRSHKEVDAAFSISEETKKYIEQFILTTSTKEKESIFKDNFIKTWSLLGETYELFKTKLTATNYAYEGMAYREVYEKLKDQSLKLPYSKISFCGFNALSVCEEEIFKTIEQFYDTEFWWDADEHFLNNKLHEAGNFLRDYQKKFAGENSHWLTDNELKKNKQIDIVGISSNIGQTQYVAQILNTSDSERESTSKTAIVLCDEHLLSPLLYTVDASNANITMGYSISQSELFLFTNALLNFYGNARISEKQTEFYYNDIAALAEHIYFNKEISEKDKLDNLLPFFVPYMPQDILADFFPATVLQQTTSSTAILETVIKTINKLHIKDNYFYPIKDAIITQLNNLLQSLEEKNITLDRNALAFIVKQFISSIKVPFETNAKSNIQIMGFLETRILDFDNLFILSLNDDNLPGTNKTNSFIPYNLRKGFGLPTFEQFDGINAYHFYRLLKCAKNIHLLYNNQISDNASEKSRFIRQIQHDLATKENTINEYIATLDDSTQRVILEKKLLQIKKTDATVALLRQRKFSPSALKVYIKCPVQFYLKYVTGIDEPEELSEEIDAAVFGQILHKVLELTYRPSLKTKIEATQISSFTEITFLRNKIKEACNELKLPKEITQGGNKLQLKIIERIAQKILENDAMNESLFILYTEEKFIWENLQLEDGTFAAVQGTFDRIDKLSDTAVRILDYKTGSIELPKFPATDDDESIQAFLDSLFIFDKKDYSAAFQGILYALMYYKLYNCSEIYVGYHHAKKMKNGITYLNEEQPIPIKLLLHFEKRLSGLVSDIVYKESHFIQTENENAYQYSVYSDLLGIG